MRRIAPVLIVACSLVGCGLQKSAPAPTPTARSLAAPTAPAATAPPKPAATVVAHPSPDYMSFLGRLCTAFRQRDAGTVINSLAYFEYNSGLRYGFLGDGEGQTGDPNLLRGWLAVDRVRCAYYTPDVAGHGLLLTRGWKEPGGRWSVIELDTFNGHWKINDFTFGRRASMWRAMQVAQPVVRYGA